MWRFSVWFALSFCVGLLAVAAVNAAFDPNHSFGFSLAKERELAELLVSGKDVATARTLNMHVVRRDELQLSSVPPDVVVLGSSRVWEIGQWLFPGQFLLNGGTASATIADYMAMWGLFERDPDKRPKTLLIGADPWIFNRQQVPEQYCRQLSGEFAEVAQALGGVSIDDCTRFVRYRDLFSLTRLETTLHSEYFLRFEAGNCRELVAVVAAPVPIGGACDLWHRDGTMNHYHVLSGDALTAFARDQGLSGRFKFFDGMNEIDGALLADFRHLLAHISEQGVRVVIYLSPFNPDYISGISESHPEDLRLLASVEAAIQEVALDVRIPVYGSYWPDRVPCRSNEYYDSIHTLPTCIEKIAASGTYRHYEVPLGGFVKVLGPLSGDDRPPAAFASDTPQVMTRKDTH